MATAKGKVSRKRNGGSRKAKAPVRAQPKRAKLDDARLIALREAAAAAAKDLQQAKAQGEELRRKATQVESAAKDAYHQAVAPYREACRKAEVRCEYSGQRAANVSEKVSFLVEKNEKGVRVMVKGKPKTDEVIPMEALKASINKAAYAFTEKHIGPREKVGNKGGSLSNRLRAVLAQK